MHWTKLPFVFCPKKHYSWMWSHASNPVAEHLEGNLFRVYFGCRDQNSRSHIGSIVIDIDADVRLLAIESQPHVAPGELGHFDDCGTSMGCLVHINQVTYLYYVGWNLATTVPFRNSIGLAIRNSPYSSFEKASVAPILDRSPIDPLSISYPWIVGESGNWRMWYGSHTRWGPNKGDMIHVIRSATSTDAVTWTRSTEVAVAPILPLEPIVCRPTVIRLADGYHMWYSRRQKSIDGTAAPYTMGYAKSIDGIRWDRIDKVCTIELSQDGFDSTEIAYPSVFNHNNTLYMLYNGNGYGRTGFGIARAT